MRRMYSKSQLIDLIEEHSAETSVTSVNDMTGDVTLKASDIKANNAATIQSNLERIDERIDDLDSAKLDKITTTGIYGRLYGISTGGAQNQYNISRDAHPADTIVQRGANGVINVGTPTANNHAATKQYVDNKIGTNILREMTLTLHQGESSWVLPSGITFARIKLDEDLSGVDGIAQWCNIYTGGQSRNGYLKYIFEGPNPQQLSPHNYLNEGVFSAYNAYIGYSATTGNIFIYDQNSLGTISAQTTFTIAIQYTL